MNYQAAIRQQSTAFRQALLQREQVACQQLADYYSSAYQSIETRINHLLLQIGQAQAEGAPVKISWLWEQARLRILQDQIAQMLHGFAGEALRVTLDLERKALSDAVLQAHDLMQAGLPGIDISWARVPEWQLTHLVGNLQDGSPLSTLFDKLAQDGAKRAGKALFQGVVSGQGPQVIARTLRDQLKISLNDALRIARTETIRVYNEAALENYKANRDVVEQWEWSAEETERTCEDCRDLDGHRFDLDSNHDVPPDHPNCRCAAIPITFSYESILARFAA